MARSQLTENQVKDSDFLSEDEHTALSHSELSRVDGTRPFTSTVSGIYPTVSGHLANKGYVDDAIYSNLLSYYTKTDSDNKFATITTLTGSYYTTTQTNNLLSGKSDTGHNHDTSYYTKSYMDTTLSGYSSISHIHQASSIPTTSGNLSGILSSSNTNVESALETISSAFVYNSSLGCLVVTINT